MKRKCIVFAITLLSFFSKNLYAQESYDSSFHFYYYDQKLSFFELMPDTKDEIIWMGDSITDNGEWNELFPQYKNLNRGISSDNTFGILYRIHEVTRRKPKKLFLLVGINDLSRNIPDSVIIRNYKRIMDSVRIKSPSTRLYVQSILPTNNEFTLFKAHQNKTAHILYLNKALENICASRKIVFIDLYNYFTDKEGKLDKCFTNDGLHLTGEGFIEWKNILLQKKIL